eukprot:TRINITY_DN8599_c0_g1_i1.p1 TRINITY_DN8599_c0_g1~~TRINITY_DN8599_c0_g1_i1.p1  ORF type:complete len:588 (-),score=94.32 TRINITY_DN8599_c0_g1_i1:38-1801(-)
MMKVLFIILQISCLFLIVKSDLVNHKYQFGDDVVVYANKVGPFNNPQEFYFYYKLPFCQPNKFEGVFEGLGESISGYELVKTPISITYDNNGGFKESVLLCQKTLNKRNIQDFIYAIKHNFWYQLFIDDLPMWGNVGEYSFDENQEVFFLYTHLHFEINFNKDQIIEVNLTTENAIIIEPDETQKDISFTYSIDWKPTDNHFYNRFDKYLDHAFFEHQIHTFSLFNSIMLVVFLGGIVSMIILRTLKREYSSIKESLEKKNLNEDSGWKQLHADVFLPPKYLLLFSSIIGISYHLIIVTTLSLLLSKMGRFYQTRGSTISTFIIIYSLTSFIAGFKSGSYYTKHNGKNWIKNMLITSSFLPGILLVSIILLNFFAKLYGSLGFVPVSTLLVLTTLWTIVVIPLTFIGTIIGKNWAPPDLKKKKRKTQIPQVPRLIPEKIWYLRSWFIILISGILPFTSIFIELYFIFSSWWHYKIYYVYGMLLLVFFTLLLVISFVSIITTYFLLNTEDYRWSWFSFYNGASTSLYIFIYSIYYYNNRTSMTGNLQYLMYFGYTGLFCFGFAILCGGVSYFAASVFVSKIYSELKTE